MCFCVRIIIRFMLILCNVLLITKVYALREKLILIEAFL